MVSLAPRPQPLPPTVELRLAAEVSVVVVVVFFLGGGG